MRAAPEFAGLKFASLHALFVLSHNPGLCVDELAERLCLDATTLSPVLAVLRARGFVLQSSCSDEPTRCGAREGRGEGVMRPAPVPVADRVRHARG